MTTLRPFQAEDAEFYHAMPFAGCLDDPRTGKTVKMLLAARTRGAQRVGIVTRAITREQWRRECQTWLPGTTRFQVWSYEELAVSPPKQDAFRVFAPDVLLLDEAQQIRNPNAKRTRVLYGRGCAGGTDALIHGVPAVWLLSGTLTPNHLGEAWTHLHAFRATRMSYYEFLHYFCTTYEGRYGTVVKDIRPERLEEYVAMVRPFFRRRRYRDVFPKAEKPRFSTLVLTPTPEGRRRLAQITSDAKYAAVQRHLMRATSAEEREAILAAAQPHTSTIREQIAAVRTPLIADEAEALLESGVSKLVIMAWHHRTLDILNDRLQTAKYRTVRVDGQTPNKDALVQQFQTDPTVAVFLGQVRAAGEGIPLHAARVMLLAELPWSAGDVLQVGQRIVSGECPDAPEIIACTLPGTIDDAVAKIAQGKAAHLGLFNTLEDA